MRYTWKARQEQPDTPSDPGPAGLPEPVRLLIQRRGLTGSFLRSHFSGLSHWKDLPGARAAAEMIGDAVDARERILVHGDFDADGITASATALRALKHLGATVDSHLPCRFTEGYGLGRTGVEKCIREGVKLLITVDCGINALEEVSQLRSQGVKVIVTDHHVPGETLPHADCVVDPELSPETSAPWRHLSGVGVIHTVLRGLFVDPSGSVPGVMEPDLAAIGTVADMVELTGDNRILVKRGLEVMGSSPSPGIAALIRASGIENGGLTSSDLGFGLGPRINSAGRIGHADTALELLLEMDPRRANELACMLEKYNSRRKELDRMVFDDAFAMLSGTEYPVAVAASDKWHSGVIGISASRISRRLNRPALLIAWEEGTGKGSARGVPGMPVHTLLTGAMETGLLSRFGGHAMAAGFSIEKEAYPSFREYITDKAASLFAGVEKPVLYIDGRLDPENCTMDVYLATGLLEPFGQGNPEPVWIGRGLYPSTYRTVGRDSRHLQVSFQRGNTTIRAIGFDMGHRTAELNRPLDIAFRLKPDSWRGGGAVQLVLEDMRPAAMEKR